VIFYQGGVSIAGALGFVKVLFAVQCIIKRNLLSKFGEEIKVTQDLD
jgi:hypothetical protein